jgi:hypothetical protein
MAARMTANRNAACRVACSALLLAALLGLDAFAAPAGEVTHVSGALLARKPDGSSKILAPQSKVESGDLLATAGDTYARVKFSDGGEVTLRPNTQFRIESFAYDQTNPTKDSALFSLIKGGLRTISGVIGKRKPESYQMRTTVATIGIRGTNYGVLLCQGDCQNLRNAEGQVPQDGLHLDVAQGAISVTNPGGVKILSVGQFGLVQNNSVPMNLVPPGQGATGNTPGFDSGPGGGSKAECVVQ